MMDYSALYAAMENTALAPWLATLPDQLDTAWDRSNHGNLNKWKQAIEELSQVTPSVIHLQSPVVQFGDVNDCDGTTRDRIERCLRRLHPWRKGPYSIFGIPIDTEWRSDWKWDRFVDHIKPLQGCNVLDVGCGNGYHCWRMAGEGAHLVLGIDPTLLYVMQYEALNSFIENKPVHVLPLGIDDVPDNMHAFDKVFSMGVLYHRPSPKKHLRQLFDCLRDSGELILETLVIEGGPGDVLVPDGRYAKMKNVKMIPSCTVVEEWLRECSYKQIRMIDKRATTIDEQRSTDWMRFQSLPDFLDSNDPTRTIEGLPAPKRAIFLAIRS